MTAAFTYFEDVVVDTVQMTPAITVTEAHVAMYQGLTRDLPLGSGDVPDVLPLCMVIGLGWRVKNPPMVVQAFVGLDWKVMKELRIGDTISSRSRIVSKRPLRDGGLVIDERTILDQHGEVVQQGKFTFLVAKRQKEASA
ncbi:MAG: MaoC family dehydratase [Candidatus Rokuibacteriota bacterium]